MTEPVQKVVLTEFTDGIRIFRLDRLTTNACGNKEFKLSANIQQLKRSGATGVLSFGGVWSNHLHAFAIACRANNLHAVAVVRGEAVHGSTLLDNAVEHGLVVHYVSRSDYRRRHDESYVKELMAVLNCDAWLPEGGSNNLAVQCCAEITALVNSSVDQTPENIALAVGTGATMAGIINGAVAGQNIIGVPVVQDNHLQASVKNWVEKTSRADWCFLSPADPQKYASVDRSLLEFVLQAYRDSGVILDPVYNAKALRYLQKVRLLDETRDPCIFIHTGGLGGCLGFAEALLAIDTQLAGELLSEVSRLLDLSG